MTSSNANDETRAIGTPPHQGTHKRSGTDEGGNNPNVGGGGANAEERSIYYKDAAIIRFQDDVVKVVRDTEFINEFRRRANDGFW